MSTPTNETLQLVELLKKEAGLQWKDEAIGLGIIQKQFEQYRNKISKKEKFYFLQVGFYHDDDKKIGFRPYPGELQGSYSGLEWTWKDKGSEINKLNISYSILKISKKEIEKKGIDLEKCNVMFSENL